MDLKVVRQRCEAVLQEVELPDPFSLDAFCRIVSHRRGRPIHRVAKSRPSGPCGIWLSLPDADYVFFDEDTSTLHRDHIVLHELGHLLLDHASNRVMDDEALRDLLPDLDVGSVRRVLGRTGYSAVEEQEAEMIATLVSERAARASSSKASGTDAAAESVIGRLNSTLAHKRNA